MTRPAEGHMRLPTPHLPNPDLHPNFWKDGKVEVYRHDLKFLIHNLWHANELLTLASSQPDNRLLYHAVGLVRTCNELAQRFDRDLAHAGSVDPAP